jgi:hypothetical protein
MPSYPVTVTASYDAARSPDDTADRLQAWAASGDGRTFVVDESIRPVRWTVTVDYQVDAATEQVAKGLAVDRFAHEADAVGISPPETVLAATGPLR